MLVKHLLVSHMRYELVRRNCRNLEAVILHALEPRRQDQAIQSLPEKSGIKMDGVSSRLRRSFYRKAWTRTRRVTIAAQRGRAKRKEQGREEQRISVCMRFSQSFLEVLS